MKPEIRALQSFSTTMDMSYCEKHWLKNRFMAEKGQELAAKDHKMNQNLEAWPDCHGVKVQHP